MCSPKEVNAATFMRTNAMNIFSVLLHCHYDWTDTQKRYWFANGNVIRFYMCVKKCIKSYVKITYKDTVWQLK